MKGGMLRLSAFQVASLRIIFAGLVLLPWGLKYIREIPKNKLGLIFLSGTFGSLIPAYLFCLAEQKVDSALAGTLNSLTPIFVLITGVLFFRSKVAANKFFGIIIAIIGSILLLVSKQSADSKANFYYGSLIVIATLFYGYNVNMVHQYLKHIGSLKIAAVALSLCALPALAVLGFTGFFNINFSAPGYLISIFYTFLLGVLGTAVATILFYMLLKRAGAVFGSMVTYGIPVVANIWGIIYGEEVGVIQFLCLLFILAGVYITNANLKIKVNSESEFEKTH